MALPIPASEIAVGDYLPDYGHVKKIENTFGAIKIIFKNGMTITTTSDDEYTVEQGGRF